MVPPGTGLIRLYNQRKGEPMRKNRKGVIGAALLAVVLIAAACGSGDGAAETVEGPEIKIGAQDFQESAILAEIYAQALRAEGYTVSIQPLGGFRDLVLASFESGDINFTPEYAASMLEFLNEFAGEATGDAEETTEALRGYLQERSLVALSPSPAIDTNAFVVTPETSESLGITTLSDLAANGADLTLGGPPDCETNPFCIPGLLTVYGLDLSANFVPLDAGSITVQALESGEIDVAVLFSTSGVIADKGWVLLDDDQSMLAADNVVPVMTSEVADAYGDSLRDLVDRISAAISTDELTEMNRRFDIDREDAPAIATAWLTEEGFLGA
jgi:osmoprotectant transport system substrate-binding protein